MMMEEWFSDGFAVQVPAGTSILDAELQLPTGATGLIVLAHAGGGRRSRMRLQGATEAFARDGFATLVMDLLTEEESEVDHHSDGMHFESDMLADRLDQSVEWLLDLPETARLSLGIYGCGCGGGAALAVAAARSSDLTALVVSGLSGLESLPPLDRIQAPALLIAAERDSSGISQSRECVEGLKGRKRLEVVQGTASLTTVQDKVSRLACLWFEQYLTA
jgi:putative phosphoribosyl transferase